MNIKEMDEYEKWAKRLSASRLLQELSEQRIIADANVEKDVKANAKDRVKILNAEALRRMK